MIICEKCNKIMGVAKVGVQIVEETEEGTSYKVWMADRHKCYGCGYSVLHVGHNQLPISERPDKDFNEQVKKGEMSFV